MIIHLGENEGGNFEVSYNELKRKLHISEETIKEEISILSRRNFIFQPEGEGFDAMILTRFDETEFPIVDFAIRNNCLKKVLVALDFQQLDVEAV